VHLGEGNLTHLAILYTVLGAKVLQKVRKTKIIMHFLDEEIKTKYQIVILCDEFVSV
jgi:hypothetical protein